MTCLAGVTRLRGTALILLLVLTACGAEAIADVPKRPAITNPSTSPRTRSSRPPHRRATIKADWVRLENERHGTTDWRIPADAPSDIEGFANVTSAQVGDDVTLFVSTGADTFRVRAYRFGYYGGDGARLVWTSHKEPGGVQAAASVDPVTNMVEAPWSPSLTFPVTRRWVQGAYLLMLIGSDGSKSYVPLTIREDASTAALVVQLPVTTWQAYNDWGGYSQYHGPDGTFATRSRVVSFDRPYTLRPADRGAAFFLDQSRPVIELAERLGLDVTYWTGVDFDRDPGLLLSHRALITLGHDEYWSSRMRDGAIRARDRGVNLAFLGANADFRHIRLAPSPLGPGRRQVGYKIASEDPFYGVKDEAVTSDWRSGPVPRPESVLNGAAYGCNPVMADMVIARASSWIFRGAHVDEGDHLDNIVGWEYDHVEPGMPTPDSIEIVAHSPVVCGGRADHADMTYYTARSGAGVVDTGTNAWVWALRCGEGRSSRDGGYSWCDPTVVTATENILRTFARGPAELEHPSKPNLARFGMELLEPVGV